MPAQSAAKIESTWSLHLIAISPGRPPRSHQNIQMRLWFPIRHVISLSLCNCFHFKTRLRVNLVLVFMADNSNNSNNINNNNNNKNKNNNSRSVIWWWTPVGLFIFTRLPFVFCFGFLHHDMQTRDTVWPITRSVSLSGHVNESA